MICRVSNPRKEAIAKASVRLLTGTRSVPIGKTVPESPFITSIWTELLNWAIPTVNPEEPAIKWFAIG